MAVLALRKQEELIGILSQLPSDGLEVIWKEVKLRKKRGIVPNFVEMEDVLNLKGLISLGGDSLKDSEKLYDE